MLNPKYRYIGLDFETTGLDLQKDEPIQLGIVEIDCQGNIVDKFQTLLRPQKEIKELKNIVSFITNIDPKDLVSAPTPEEIIPQIDHFFTENTIVIGHNIAFDLSFLNRFFPGLKYFNSIDTFQLSQAMVPYAPSHALEILSQYLEEKPLFLERKSKFGLNFSGVSNSDETEKEGSFHDAFFDTKATLALFCYLINFLNIVQEKFPTLTQLLNKSDCILTQIIFEGNSRNNNYGIFTLPALKKIAPSNTTLTNFPYQASIENLANSERFYVGNLDFYKLLQSLLVNKKVILAFSSKQKVDIAKNLLNDMGIKNIGFAREEQTISSSLFQTFLNKSEFSDFEILFIIKYCVHLFYGYGVLDLNSKGDYQVYNFIKDSRKIIRYPIVLTTHQGLYSLLEKGDENYSDFQIVFFDTERRYRNYNQYLSRTCDLYYIQNFIDILMYKYGLLQGENLIKEGTCATLQEFDTFFTMFIGILRTDTKKLFINRPEDEIQINPIVSSIDFYQTNLLLPKFKSYKEILENSLQTEDFKVLRSQIEHFFSITETVAKVERKMYNQSDFYFLFSEDTKFTNWNEFLDIFETHHTIFLSNLEKSYTQLVPNIHEEKSVRIPTIKSISDFEKFFNQHIKQGEKIFFIASTVKDESREIFEYLQTLPDLSDFNLLVENITGGAGKNIYKAEKSPKSIIVGGYKFLMMCYAQGIKIDQLVIRNIKGAQTNLILSDMLRYSR